MSPDLEEAQRGPPVINMVIVGDSYVGKTCLLKSYLTRECPKSYEIPSLERYFEDITIDGQDFHLVLWEPVTHGCYDKMRKFIYGKADCILMCYDVHNCESFQRISSFWHPEVQEHCSNVPVIIVATKIDLRDTDWNCISLKDGKKLKEKLDVSDIVECSSFFNIGIKEVFVRAVQCLPKEEKCKVS